PANSLYVPTSFRSVLLQYHFINENKSWDQARLYCKDNNHTDLATVSSMADMNRLRQHLGNRNTWIGLYREANGSRMWQWSQPDVKFNESQKDEWYTNEPNDVNTENCGTLWTDKKWADLSCDRKQPFICYDGENVQSLNWTDAQSFCRNRHTDLISGPQQIKKLDWGMMNALVHKSQGGFIFIGLFRDAWQWSDGSSFSFRFWNLQTWEEALYYCRHHHHDLVTITNPEDQIWVQEKTKNASSPFVWTGLRYTCSLGFWFWVSDEVVHYKNWASPGQVNECDMSGAMETGGEHKWFDSSHNEYICVNSK
uniref:C-type lectin domain-containing protein n=1 Tax=Oryzias latipes TaxID=8090 RepID=A0A3B3HHH6_ORYLA